MRDQPRIADLHAALSRAAAAQAWLSVAMEYAAVRMGPQHFVTHFIRTQMVSAEGGRAQLERHVAARAAAAAHVRTQHSQPVKTDGFWSAAELKADATTAAERPQPAQYATAAENQQKVASKYGF